VAQRTLVQVLDLRHIRKGLVVELGLAGFRSLGHVDPGVIGGQRPRDISIVLRERQREVAHSRSHVQDRIERIGKGDVQRLEDHAGFAGRPDDAATPSPTDGHMRTDHTGDAGDAGDAGVA
jgi:hypothetical protein